MIVLSGGTGTPKLLLGLKELLAPSDLSIVVNTAEDLWISGNFVSPDVDTVLYTLAGIIDDSKWWGIKGDSFHTYEFLRTLGRHEILALGDKDRAAHIFRSEILRNGATLSDSTAVLAKALGIKQKVLPMTDDPVSTFITTPEGEMHFQEFWVRNKGIPEVISIRFQGIEDAQPSPGFLELLSKEETVIIGPSNPVTSIGPILALHGVRDALLGKKVIAISPFVGNKPVSGPAARFMRARGVSTNDEGVAAMLGRIDTFVVDLMSGYPGKCNRLDTLMRNRGDSIRLAREVLELI
ncbi:MAG: 2-phospho-L-lactate transferase [Methanotrichaceae archaeon]